MVLFCEGVCVERPLFVIFEEVLSGAELPAKFGKNCQYMLHNPGNVLSFATLRSCFKLQIVSLM